MTYELAKQLKDAGFPQNLNLLDSFTYKQEPVYFPTLSELIEACMDFYYPSHFELSGLSSWFAVLRDEPNLVGIAMATGETPEEAVAKLWLELNKK